jgi:hypothetical protein
VALVIGRGAETEGHIQEAFRLSPRDTGAFRWMHYVGTAKLALGADAEAVAWLRRSLEANRNNPVAHFHLAAALALLGSLDGEGSSKGWAFTRSTLHHAPLPLRCSERKSDFPRWTRAHLRVHAHGWGTGG